jgi:hypothetical protein
MREQETIFNMSLKNSENMQDLHKQMAKKKGKIVYYEKKVDILKKSVVDMKQEQEFEKSLIVNLKTKIKQ